MGSVTKRPRAGVVLPRVVYRVADVDTTGVAAHLADYQGVVGEPVSDVLPAGFLHVLTFPLATAVMVRPDFPLGLLGMVHLRNTARVFRPVGVGDRLEIRAWAEHARAHRRGVQVDLVAEAFAGGVPVYRGVSTYLAKGFSVRDGASTPSEWAGPDRAASEGALPGREVPDGAMPDRAADGAGRPASRAPWVPPLPTARWRLPRSIGPEYGAVSGDRNPIHMSALGAKAFGFPRAIAHGMYTAARALAEVGPARRGDAYEWTAEFFKPVLLPGSVDVAIRYASDAGAGAAPAVGPEGGFVYDAWRAGRTTRHLTGTVTPL
ncbi:hypothetical protein IHE71_01610 [Myceligenerans sp. TRM 65318]|uniref:MaoC-like domain-containing protein n=2 Tax=Myceligenerans pegani TaxID=2776917 RepID=A0ABR9MU29_9MICO|nr:hypothetical protein [Myceligenerans sp. TRM 65318]MBE3016674.1 hypothetical protein [Myceligenerans sp. TRM 65318]